MKRNILVASLMLVIFMLAPDIAIAKAPTRQHSKQYLSAYHKARHKFGARAVGCNLIGKKGSCHRSPSDSTVMKSIGVLQRMLAPPPVVTPSITTQTVTYSTSNYTPTSYTSSYASSYSGGGNYADVPGVPSSFASCVAMRESTDGKLSSNIYGIQGSGGTGSVDQQKTAFSHMYATRGTQPWAPYDGC